ncbi:MAG: hypothetical protein ACMUEL_02230 [Flavobacteriales bacterium Tduv]
MIISTSWKTTNAMEEVVETHFLQGSTDSKIDEIYRRHLDVFYKLFSVDHGVFLKIEEFFEYLKAFLRSKKVSEIRLCL